MSDLYLNVNVPVYADFIDQPASDMLHRMAADFPAQVSWDGQTVRLAGRFDYNAPVVRDLRAVLLRGWTVSGVSEWLATQAFGGEVSADQRVWWENLREKAFFPHGALRWLSKGQLVHREEFLRAEVSGVTIWAGARHRRDLLGAALTAGGKRHPVTDRELRELEAQVGLPPDYFEHCYLQVRSPNGVKYWLVNHQAAHGEVLFTVKQKP